MSEPRAHALALGPLWFGGLWDGSFGEGGGRGWDVLAFLYFTGFSTCPAGRSELFLPSPHQSSREKCPILAFVRGRHPELPVWVLARNGNLCNCFLPTWHKPEPTGSGLAAFLHNAVCCGAGERQKAEAGSQAGRPRQNPNRTIHTRRTAPKSPVGKSRGPLLFRLGFIQ